MNRDLLFKVKGYLAALADVISFFKSSYSYIFDFINLENSLNAEEAVKKLTTDPDFLLSRHDITNPRLEKCSNWEKELLDVINRWFFNDIAFSESEIGYYESDDGQKIPLNRVLEYNYIAIGLIKNINSYLGEAETNVYKINTEETEQEEFAWEQYIFEVNLMNFE